MCNHNFISTIRNFMVTKVYSICKWMWNNWIEVNWKDIRFDNNVVTRYDKEEQKKNEWKMKNSVLFIIQQL